MANKDGEKKKRTLKGDLQRLGHYLGLYPNDPHGRLVKQPPAPEKPDLSCGVQGCNITRSHRHVPLRFDYTFDASGEPEPMSNPGPNHPANRGAHFEQGSTEHLPEGVVSLNAYRESKAKRKPEGY